MSQQRTSPAALPVLAVLVGGAAGTLARVVLGRALPHGPAEWPWATFAANLAGAFVLGWVTARLSEAAAASRLWRLLVGTGFCGALTTFSTLQVETIQIARAGHAGLAAAYAAISIAAGMAAVALAFAVARRRRSS